MTIGLTARVLAWLSGIVVALVLLFIGNYVCAERYLLRLDWPRDPFADIHQHLVPIATPVVLATGNQGRDAPVVQRFLTALGVHAESLPDRSDSLVAIDSVTRMNPYPQPLSAMRADYVSYVSFGYIGVDGRYHQVSYYSGESDTTPSFLVRKVRGPETGWGDYYVRYTVFLSKDLTPHPLEVDTKTGNVTRWEEPRTRPDIDQIEWSTYEGGGYNGFEEIEFALTATCLEGIGLLIVWRRWAGRRSSHKPLQPTNGA